MDLAVEDHRIAPRSTVIDGEIAEDFHPPGFAVDLDVGEMGPKGEHRSRRIEGSLYSEILRAFGCDRPFGDVLQRHESAWHAPNMQPSIRHHHIGGRGFEGGCYQRAHTLLQGAGPLVNRRA